MSADPLSPRTLVSRLLSVLLFAGIAALVLATLPGLGEVRGRFGEARAGWVAVALVLEAGSVIAFVVALRGVFGGRLPWRFSAQVGLSEQATNVLLPAGGAGGLALGAWALSRAGMEAGHIARRTVAFFLITSSANFVAAVVAGVGLATGVLGGGASVALAVVPAALALAVMAGVALLPRVLPHPTPRRAVASRASARRGPPSVRACTTRSRCCGPAAPPSSAGRPGTWPSTCSRWRRRSTPSVVRRRRGTS